MADGSRNDEGAVSALREFANEVKARFTDVMLLGMGGSSLCPEVFARTFYHEPGYPRLHMLDSTVPAEIRALEKKVDIARTLFIVSSKSGGTVETLSHCAYFCEQVKERIGSLAGRSFVAITDRVERHWKNWLASRASGAPLSIPTMSAAVFLHCPILGLYRVR
jgi:glucose-6-phosphate isomerase